MKSFKIIFGSLAVAFLALSLSSFVAKSYDHVAFARVCYKYSPPDHQQVDPPTTFRKKRVTKSLFNSLDQTEFTTTTNWVSITAGSGNPSTSCNGGDYVCAICFTDNVSPDAGRTLQQALNDAWTYYAAHTPGFTDGTDMDATSLELTIYLKSTDANF